MTHLVHDLLTNGLSGSEGTSEEALHIYVTRMKEIALLLGEATHQDRDKNTFILELLARVRFPPKNPPVSSTLGHTVDCRFLGCRSCNYVIVTSAHRTSAFCELVSGISNVSLL